MTGIYSFRNKFNQKRYIGQSIDIEGRYKSHLKHYKQGKDNLLYRAFNKYGVENFDFEVLIECPKDNLNYWEQFYIKYYITNNPQYGYNMTEGGDSYNIGHIPWNKGKRNVYSSKTIERNRQAHLGKVSPRKGVSLPDETKRKMGIIKGKHRVYNEDGTYKYI